MLIYVFDIYTHLSHCEKKMLNIEIIGLAMHCIMIILCPGFKGYRKFHVFILNLHKLGLFLLKKIREGEGRHMPPRPPSNTSMRTGAACSSSSSCGSWPARVGEKSGMTIPHHRYLLTASLKYLKMTPKQICEISHFIRIPLPYPDPNTPTIHPHSHTALQMRIHVLKKTQ